MSPINSTMQGFYWGGIIILILIIAASIWLLARGGGTVCDNRGKINESCSEIGDCNSGLVCTVSPGGDGECKVASGGVCETTSECGSNLTCQNGTCQGRAGGLNDPCPCGEGFTCVNNVCKVKVGGPCIASADCADSGPGKDAARPRRRRLRHAPVSARRPPRISRDREPARRTADGAPDRRCVETRAARRTWTLIMAGAGVPCQIRTIRKKRLHPHGTGPNGRVRFGDDMMPSEYHLCIPKRFHETAEKALLEHENSVHKWLHEAGKMPDACRP